MATSRCEECRGKPFVLRWIHGDVDVEQRVHGVSGVAAEEMICGGEA
jgi:hypothetical protein